MTSARPRRLFGIALAVSLALGVSACGSSSDTTSSTGSTQSSSSNLIQSNPANGKVSLTIGSKNFTEEFILGEIYAQALQAAGYEVHKQLNLGSETIALKALQNGDISGYPEYTSTALGSFFQVPPQKMPADADQAAAMAAPTSRRRASRRSRPRPSPTRTRSGR